MHKLSQRVASNQSVTRSSRPFDLPVLLALGCVLVSIFLQSVQAQTTTNRLSLAVFTCDVTPPIGHPLCGGWIKPLEAVDDPLLAKGVVLSDGQNRYVLCAVDWCLLQTEAYDLFRTKLAKAVDVPVSHVAVQTVHQHNAPIADVRAQKILNEMPGPPLHLDLAFMNKVTDRLAASATDARKRLQPFTHVAVTSNRVEKVASNRRVRLPDGKIHPRFSSTRDPALQAAPEGLIDPWLRTVTFLNEEKPLVRLHYYATHPQSYYGDGRATADSVGLARERLEHEENVPQLYFTGCAGDITMGKYNDGSPAARLQLADRFYAAMKAAAASVHPVPASALDWQTAEVKLASRPEPEWSAETSRATLCDTNAALTARLNAALNLAWLERLDRGVGVGISRLSIGPATILNLPGEAFLEYQLYAQSLRPTGFVAVAAYGEGGPGYICTDASLNEGGYEPTDARVGAPSEFRLKDAIAQLLGPAPSHASPQSYTDKLHVMKLRDSQGRERPITTAADWNTRREQIRSSMQLVMGLVPAPSRAVPLNPRIEEEIDCGTFTRQKITFAVEEGDRVPAYLLVPNQTAGKRPAVLCLHQTIAEGKAEPVGLAGRTNRHYALELTQRGFVTLTPDYPNFGDYRLDVYAKGYQSATMKGIWNHMRAVDLLETLPQVDKERVAVFGHSLGGHNALFLAAFDQRLKAVVTSCGFNSFFHYSGGDLRGWSHQCYMPRIATVYECDPKKMPFDFTEVLASLAPRPTFINAPVGDDNFPLPGVYDCVLAAQPVYRLLEAEGNLVFERPESGHDFPPEVRESAYEWLETKLH